MINKQLLNILCCPKCKGILKLNEMFLLCKNCTLGYPILGNIPNMLIDDAWTIEKATNNKFMHSIKEI